MTGGRRRQPRFRVRLLTAAMWLSATAALAMPVGFLLLDQAYPPDLSRLQSLSQEVVDRHGVPLRAYLSEDGFRRLPATTDAVDPGYVDMLVAFEDRRFWTHRGVDPLALLRAVWQAAGAGRVVSGGSTLTMQAARLLEPRPRTVVSKLIEMFRAVQLEHRFSKPEILSIYMTVAPFGGNLEGVAAASRHYFGRPPRHLTPEEVALLVALPQSPTRLRPDRHPDAARAARDKVLERAAGVGLLDSRELKRAMAQGLFGPRRSLPISAPHLADRVRGARPQDPVIRTSLDGTLQRHWEGIARRSADALGPAVSVAVLAVENQSRQAVAYIGSADFADVARAGQVDVVQALRSPGSALKPVLYALAFEQGIAHPATLVDDVPTQFGDYAPANFMQRHYGRITLTEALQRSLNVPAVALLDRLGPVAVAEKLRRAGVRLDFGGADAVPGLAFALGGVGTTLEDLVGLYAALADDGRLRPIVFLAAGPEGDARDDEGTRLFGEVARWYVGEILRGVPPPDSLLPDRYRRVTRPLAFKTGTSYGFRDAWAVAYNADYTIGVWVGRPDGTPNPGRFGANTAAPILFRLFDDLPPEGRRRPAVPRHALPRDAPLPPGLRLLGEDFAQSRFAANTPPPRILFPLDKTVIRQPSNGRPLVLEVEGGRQPLTWIANGMPLEIGRAHGRVHWRPDGLGFHEIVLVDGLGRRAAAHIRLVGP